jgi:hypothetical protein
MSFLTSREQVAPQGIGKPVRRREDARLLTGGGRFADETNLHRVGYRDLLVQKVTQAFSLTNSKALVIGNANVDQNSVIANVQAETRLARPAPYFSAASCRNCRFIALIWARYAATS